MLPLRRRKQLGNLFSKCTIVIMAALCLLIAFSPEAPKTSLPRDLRQEHVVPWQIRVIPSNDETNIAATLKRLPEVKETLQRGMFGGMLGHSVMVDRLAYGSQIMRVLLHESSPNPLLHTDYVHRMKLAPPLSMAESAWPWPPQPPPLRTSDLQEVDDYFTYLKTPQARCRKVVIMGGHHTCGDVTDDLVDGSKVVCMDPPLGLLPIRDPTTCLTLSFGIHFDSTFDVAVSKFNCEVHMFDLLDYSPTELLNTSTHAYFHQVGLSDARRQHIYLNIHQEVPMDTLTGIILNNSLIARPVNILKVDIEDDEWRVFQSLSQDPIMDIIGQVAIEIHAEELNKLAPEQRLPYVRHRYDILRALEARGFTKVAYWDNKISETFTAASGAAYKTSGEIHYVNSNWYNSSFKENLKKMGVRMR